MAITTKTQTVNLTVYQGADFEHTIIAKDNSGANVTISSGTCTGKLRQSPFSGNNVFSFSTSIDGSNCTISLTDTVTATIPGDRSYTYDIEYTQSGGTVERLAEGMVRIGTRNTGDGAKTDV